MVMLLTMYSFNLKRHVCHELAIVEETELYEALYSQLEVRLYVMFRTKSL